MPLTGEQMQAALAAQRMRQDPHFQAILDRIVADAAGRAMFLDDPVQRENYRRIVLAINLIRSEIESDATLPEAERAAETLARSME